MKLAAEGAVSQKATVEGFKFLVDAAQEINLKAVNCSWGNVRAEFILTVMANELGKKGVNIVFASGNRMLDLDDNIDSGGQINSILCARSPGKCRRQRHQRGQWWTGTVLLQDH